MSDYLDKLIADEARREANKRAKFQPRRYTPNKPDTATMKRVTAMDPWV